MATLATPESRSFPFETVELFLEERLGHGAFGFVCRARCDKLPVAAKLLHNALLEFKSDEVEGIIKKFIQECQILETIIHPNIVQFIGVVRILDGAFQHKLALLTELMDDSLTHFIKLKADAQEDIPYHVEVDLAYDVVLAISFLHSRGILHRDLSSNNILIQGGKRAKVTDFGMAKFQDMTTQRSQYLTQCPGTVVFMPPEALWEPPEYSQELDVFSWGVVCFHILSREYPSPTQMHSRETDDHGRMVAVFVPELIRRRSSIESVSEGHPLRPIAMESIKDAAKERPSSNDLCDRLEKLRHDEGYLSSLRAPSRESQLAEEVRHYMEHAAQLEEELARLRVENLEEGSDFVANTLPSEMQELLSENELLRSKVDSLTADLKKLKKRYSRQENSFSHNVSSSNSNGVLNVQPSKSTGPFNWENGHTPAPVDFTKGSATVYQNMAYFSRPHSSIIYCYNSTEKLWTKFSECPVQDFTLTVLGQKLVAIGGVKVSMKGMASKPVKEVHCFDLLLGSRWESETIPPMFTARVQPAVTSHGNMIMVAGGRKGQRAGSEPLSSVEIYCSEPNSWYCAYNLPKPLLSPWAVMCEDEVFVVGCIKCEGPSTPTSDVVFHSAKSEEIEVAGCSRSDSKLSDVIYHISLPLLYKWSNRTIVPISIRSVWTHLSTPTLHATPISVNNTLFLMGGAREEQETYLEPSSNVLKLKKEQGRFGVYSMPRARAQCVAAVLSSCKVLLVGGCDDKTMDYAVSTEMLLV